MEDRFKSEMNKAAAVINSCRTISQVDVAFMYIQLAVWLWAYRKHDKTEAATAENVLLKRLELRQRQIAVENGYSSY